MPKKAVKKRRKPGVKVQARAREVHERLSRAIPEPFCELDHRDAWQLLVATILAAQANDKTINKITPALFERFPTPAALGAAKREVVEELVKSSGYFRQKTKAICEASQAVADRFGGVVPKTMEEITQLPGVARKTGNVVLGTAYGVPSGIIVDTHVGRVSRRLGLTTSEDPEEVEQDLQALFPKERWIETGHRLVLHGRYVCVAKTPRCEACPLAELCPSRLAKGEGDWTGRADEEQRLVESRGAAQGNAGVRTASPPQAQRAGSRRRA